MTTPASTDDQRLLLAEYALGVLDGELRARVAQQVQESISLSAELAAWQQRLMPLADDIAPVAPAPEVWERIQNELGFNLKHRASAPVRRVSVWNNVRFWRWLGLGATTGFAALAATVGALFLAQSPNAPKAAAGLMAWVRSSEAPTGAAVPTPAPAVQGYQFATLVQGSGAISWTATVDPAQARMIVAPAEPVAVADDRSAELWLVPAHGKPIALGLLMGRVPSVVVLSDTVMHALSDAATLAVSIEPLGGSASGQPTGPIVAKGQIRGV